MSDEKKPRKKTGGRVAGVPNKRTLIGKDVAETLKNWLGFDSAAVERGELDTSGYRGRLKLQQMWNGERPVDPAFVTVAKFLFSYAYGHPGKMVMESGPKRSPVVFVDMSGFKPWDPQKPINKELNARSSAMIAAKESQLALEAADRKAAEVIEVEPAKADPDAEGLEVVVPLPAEDPSAYR